MNIFGPILLSLIAAIGNALFAYGQKKAVVLDNQFTFIVFAVFVCLVLSAAAAPLFGQANYTLMLRENRFPMAISGLGLFIAYVGFNILYTQYGASSYILYAVLSIITTAIIVGVLLFKETFNVFHWLAFFASIVTIILFTLGNRAS